MSSLIPKNAKDVMVIRDISQRITTLSVPFWRHGTVGIGGRATLVQLQSGSLAVFSPVELTDDVRQKIGQRSVAYIIAPDIEHHIFLTQWHKDYPGAKVIAPEGLKEKRLKSKVDNSEYAVPFSHIFTRENKRSFTIDPEFDAEFDYEYVETHPNRELVFNFKPERTLIEADLLFNMPATEQFSKHPGGEGRLTRWLAPWGSALGNATAQKRMIYHGFSRGGRPAFNESMQRIAKWDFDRIIPCHGNVIETNGKAVFTNIMEWNLHPKDSTGGDTK